MDHISTFTSKQFSTTKKTVLSGIFIATGILLPMVLHLSGLPGGPVLLPMHLPVFLAGMICGAPFGALIGLVLPIVSTVLTGMPKLFPTVLLMSIELCVYGLVSGVLFSKFPRHKMLALIGAMISGRLAYAAALLFAGTVLHIQVPKVAALAASVMTGLPGIISQLILIPILIKIIEMHYGSKGVKAGRNI